MRQEPEAERECRAHRPEEATAVPTEGGSTRRGILAGAGLVGAAGVLAACGGSAGGGGVAGAALGQVGDIPVGGGKVFKDEKVVVTQPRQGQFKAFSAVCTHQGCTVASVSNGTINCACHGSKFMISDGAVADGPADSPLDAKEIKVNGNEITLA